MEAEKIIERANKAVTDAFNNGSEFERKRLIEKAKAWLKVKNETCMFELEMILGSNFIEDFVKYLEE